MNTEIRHMYYLFLMNKATLCYSFPNSNYDSFPAIKWPDLSSPYAIHMLASDAQRPTGRAGQGKGRSEGIGLYFKTADFLLKYGVFK